MFYPYPLTFPLSREMDISMLRMPQGSRLYACLPPVTHKRERAILQSFLQRLS